MAKGSVMGKDPATLWYWNDWAGGTITYSRHLKGCYMDLLCAQFNTGPLSLDEIRVVLGSDFGSAWPALQKKFIQDEDGKYYNDRLMSELIKRKAFNSSRSNSLNIDNQDMVHIYILSDPDTGTYKIGGSKYPALRLKEAQKHITGAEMYWYSDALVVRTVEKDLHAEFSAKRSRYDWFSLNQTDLENITNRTIFKSRTGNENGTGYENEIEDILELLNTTIGADFKKTAKKNVSVITARLKEGYTVDDFAKVIQSKWESWGKDPKMKEFLRPETLFGNKMEGYLQTAKIVPAGKVDGILAANARQEEELKRKYGKA